MSHASRFGRNLIGIVAMFSVLGGCGPGSNPNAPATISGKVTYKGAPVSGGTLYFHAEGIVYPTSIDNDGTYLGRDFPVGDMVVTVDTETVNPARKGTSYDPQAAKMEEYKPPEGVTVTTATYVKIPAKYADKTKSGLKVTITPGKQVKDIELTD